MTYYTVLLVVIIAKVDGMRFAGKRDAPLGRPRVKEEHRLAQQREAAGSKQWKGNPKAKIAYVPKKKVLARPPQRVCMPFNESKALGSPGSRGWMSGWCDGKDDLISWEPIRKGKGACLEGQCYDVENLAKVIESSTTAPTVPHSRTYFSMEHYEILTRSKQRKYNNTLAQTLLTSVQAHLSSALIEMVYRKAGSERSAFDVLRNMQPSAALCLSSDAIELIYNTSGPVSANEILKRISPCVRQRSIEKVYAYNRDSLGAAEDVLKNIQARISPEVMDVLYNRSQSISMANDIIKHAQARLLYKGSVELIFEKAGSKTEAADVLKQMHVLLPKEATAMIYKMAGQPVDANDVLKNMKSGEIMANAIKCIYDKAGSPLHANEVIKAIQAERGLQKETIEKIYSLFGHVYMDQAKEAGSGANYVLKHMQASLSPEAVDLIYREAGPEAFEVLTHLRAQLEADVIELIYHKAGAENANDILKHMGIGVEWSLPKIELIYNRAASPESANEIMKHMRMQDTFWESAVELIFDRAGASAEDVLKNMKVALQTMVIEDIYRKAGEINDANDVLKNMQAVYVEEEVVEAIYSLAGSASAANDVLKNMRIYMDGAAIAKLYSMAYSKEVANDILKRMKVYLCQWAISSIFKLTQKH